MASPLPLEAADPARLGGCELLGRIGTGGQGVVFLGRPLDPGGGLPPLVAVKLLHTRLLDSTAARGRFVRELALLQRVAGFCTAQMLAADTAGDRPYIVSEYVEGRSLRDLVLQEGPRTGADLDRLAIGSVTALTAIHRAGIVHRDFKPQNVLMGRDGPRVIDFGIARAFDAGATLTSQVVGTPAYMAPEQFTGRVGPATDLFAWAATVLFAATGRDPFAGGGVPAVMYRILHETPDLSALPGPIAEVAAACLARDPAARPTSEHVLMRLLGETGGPPHPVHDFSAPTGLTAVHPTARIPGPRPPTPAPAPAPTRAPAPAPTTSFGPGPTSGRGPMRVHGSASGQGSAPGHASAPGHGSAPGHAAAPVQGAAPAHGSVPAHGSAPAQGSASGQGPAPAHGLAPAHGSAHGQGLAPAHGLAPGSGPAPVTLPAAPAWAPAADARRSATPTGAEASTRCFAGDAAPAPWPPDPRPEPGRPAVPGLRRGAATVAGLLLAGLLAALDVASLAILIARPSLTEGHRGGLLPVVATSFTVLAAVTLVAVILAWRGSRAGAWTAMAARVARVALWGAWGALVSVDAAALAGHAAVTALVVVLLAAGLRSSPR